VKSCVFVAMAVGVLLAESGNEQALQESTKLDAAWTVSAVFGHAAWCKYEGKPYRGLAFSTVYSERQQTTHLVMAWAWRLHIRLLLCGNCRPQNRGLIRS
jgi:hypothetical protein